jgi:hypothetical protein
VSEPIRNDFRVDARLKRDRRVRVPEAMQGNPPQTGGCDVALERFRERLRMDRPPSASLKDELGLVLPCLPGREPLLDLALAVIA